MGVDAKNDSSATLRRERLCHCSSTTESTDAARSVLALQGPAGAQSHGGQRKDRGQDPTEPKGDEGWLAVIFPDCIPRSMMPGGQ